MIRGTTPTLCFTLPFKTDTLSCAYVTFSKQGKVMNQGECIFEKTLDECCTDGNKLSVTLTQEETLKLDCTCNVEIQVRAKTKLGDALASNIITCDVGRILKDGVI